MSNHSKHAPERDFPYQKYVLLSSQQDELRRKLSLQTSKNSPTLSASSPDSMPIPISISPAHHFSPLFWASPPSTSTMSAYAAPTSAPGADLEEEATKLQLHDINQQIKATLTSLLNCDSVRHDDKFRAWVQSRLMETEMEMRKQRRRRSSTDRITVEAIASSFDGY